jgi:hypothetical protein
LLTRGRDAFSLENVTPVTGVDESQQLAAVSTQRRAQWMNLVEAIDVINIAVVFCVPQREANCGLRAT